MLNKESPVLRDAKIGTVLKKIFDARNVTALDGSAGEKACVTNGVSSITGGTGIADLTLAAPTEGDLATIRIRQRTSGNIDVTCATGVTLDGTHNMVRFAAAEAFMILAYKSPTQWQIINNSTNVLLYAV
jgi:hypothetical protein